MRFTFNDLLCEIFPVGAESAPVRVVFVSRYYTNLSILVFNMEDGGELLDIPATLSIKMHSEILSEWPEVKPGDLFELTFYPLEV